MDEADVADARKRKSCLWSVVGDKEDGIHRE